MTYWFVVDYTCDAIYVMDMLFVKPRLQFIKGGITVVGFLRLKIVCFPQKTSLAMLLNYKDSFTAKMDLLSVLPTDFFYYLIGPLSLIRVNRVFKVGRGPAAARLPSDPVVLGPLRHARQLRVQPVRHPDSPDPLLHDLHHPLQQLHLLHAQCLAGESSPPRPLYGSFQAFGQIAYKENGKYYLNKWVYNNQGNSYIRCFYFTAAVATSTGNNPAPTNVIEWAVLLPPPRSF